MFKFKYLYIALIIVLGIGVSIFVYMSVQGSTEEQINSLSKTSTKFVKSINACRNARLEIDNKVFELRNEIAEVPDINAPGGTLILKYGNHAVRGYMDSGSSNDMVCTYDLSDGSQNIKTYVSVLTGLTEDSFVMFDSVFLGQNITITDMKILGGGMAKIIFKENKTNNVTEKTIYLDGDVLSFM